MRKFLLTLAAGTAGALLLGASVPYARTLSGQIKVVNTRGHSATQRIARAEAPFRQAPKMKEAPANAVEVPFTHSLGKSESVTSTYLPFDVNGDGKTWKVGGYTTYSACLGPDKTKTDANDDWMISPPVHLLAGKEYQMDFEEGVNTPNATKAGVMSVWIGSAQDPSAMTTELIAAHDITTDFTPVSHKFTVEADGYYHVGFHNTTTAAKTAISKLRNFSLQEAAAIVVPPAAGELSYTLAPKGELKATVTYTPPTKDQNGGDLESISKVEVKTNWVLTHTFTDVTPGEPITFETELYNSAYNKIEAIAYVADTPGEACVVKDFYAGPDNPLPVENVTVTLSDDYKHVTVSWNPVGETGENGGYVDPSKVTYYIFDAFGSYYDPALAECTSTSYTFDYSDLAEQDFVAYQVTAGVDETYYSLASTSPIVVVGEPEKLPFTESFADAYFSQVWAIDPQSTDGMMTGTLYDNELQTNMADEDADPVYLNSQDGDNGFFYMMPYEGNPVYGFFSAKIDLTGAYQPVFEFWYQGQGSALDVMVAADGGEFQVLKSIDLKATPTDPDPAKGWTLSRTDLSQFKQNRYIQIEIRMRAIHNDDETTWSVPLDNIRVRDLSSADLRLVRLQAPRSVAMGETISIEANVENLGTETMTGATVQLYLGSELIKEEALPELPSNGFATVKFSEPTSVLTDGPLAYTVKVVAPGDTYEANNEASATVEVEKPAYPGVEGFEAVASDGSTQLTWTAPAIDELTSPVSVAEDFENPGYEAFTIENFGGWTLYDGDKGRTYTFLNDVLNPYRTSPMAYQLYHPAAAGMDPADLPNANPHSGEKMLVAWSTNGTNDNWLISPELSGDAQTVTFFAKSFTIAFPESFEVYYSTGSKDVEDFVKVTEVANYPENGEVSEFWTEYSFAVPAGAKYFAVRHTAVDTYALYLDDFSFLGASVLPEDTDILGYNIYRNGVKINETPLNDTSVLDTPETDGSYSYRVTTVYNHGESAASEPQEVLIDTTGLSGAAAGSWSVCRDGNCLVVNGAEGLQLVVAAADGRLFHSVTATATVRLPLPAGVYVVSAGGKTLKVIL